MSDSLEEVKAELLEDFHDPDFREVYVNEFLNAKIATQIKVLREQRELTQEQLAGLAEMKQERICVLEDVNYDSWTLNVLRRFAKAFDLRVDIDFKDFGSFLDDMARMNRKDLERTSFENDEVFNNPSVKIVKRRFKVIAGKKVEDEISLQGSLFRPSLAVDNGDSYEVAEYDSETMAPQRRTG